MRQSDFAQLLDDLGAGKCVQQEARDRRRWNATKVASLSPPLAFPAVTERRSSRLPLHRASAYEANLTGENGPQQPSMAWLTDEFNAALALLSQAQTADPNRATAIRRRYAKRCHPDLLPQRLRCEANRLMAEINAHAGFSRNPKTNGRKTE